MPDRSATSGAPRHRARTQHPLIGGKSSQLDCNFEAAFSPSSENAPRMRHFATAAARAWYGDTPLLDDLALLVTELVTNAIEHGEGTACLRVTATGDVLQVEVTDSSPHPAQLRAPGTDEVCGRGLVLVTALAHTWGVTDDGHTTWATLTLAAQDAETA